MERAASIQAYVISFHIQFNSFRDARQKTLCRNELFITRTTTKFIHGKRFLILKFLFRQFSRNNILAISSSYSFSFFTSILYDFNNTLLYLLKMILRNIFNNLFKTHLIISVTLKLIFVSKCVYMLVIFSRSISSTIFSEISNGYGLYPALKYRLLSRENKHFFQICITCSACNHGAQLVTHINAE